jgi:hypothetical protein
LIAASAKADEADRVLALFQAKAGALLEARELNLETGEWRTLWTRTLDPKRTKAIFFLCFSDRVGVLLSKGSERLYVERARSDGKAVGQTIRVSSFADALLSLANRPLAISSGGYRRLLSNVKRPTSESLSGLQATGTVRHDGMIGMVSHAAVTPDGKYILVSQSEARAGSSHSLIDCYRLGLVTRKLTESLLLDQGISGIAVTNSVAAIAGQDELQLYSIGPSGIKLFASSSSNPRVDAIFPTRDGRGFYGQTQAGLVAIIPHGKGWVRKRLID